MKTNLAKTGWRNSGRDDAYKFLYLPRFHRRAYIRAPQASATTPRVDRRRDARAERRVLTISWACPQITPEDDYD